MDGPLDASREPGTEVQVSTWLGGKGTNRGQDALCKEAAPDFPNPHRAYARLLVKGNQAALHEGPVRSKGWGAVCKPFCPGGKFSA